MPKGLNNVLHRYLLSSVIALFTIARQWKQPKCPSANEFIRKLWCSYAMEYYLSEKESHELCQQMDGTRRGHTE